MSKLISNLVATLTAHQRRARTLQRLKAINYSQDRRNGDRRVADRRAYSR